MRSLSRQSRERVLDTSVCSREKGYNWAYVTCSGKHKNTHDYTYYTHMITSHWCCVWKQSYQMNTHLSLYVSACQCNGHSTCVNGSVCEQCKNLTTGPQCQICLPGYYGDPTNGGKCQGEIFLFMCMCTSICLSVCVLVCICIWKSESVSFKNDFVSVEQDKFSRISRCCFPLNESE